MTVVFVNKQANIDSVMNGIRSLVTAKLEPSKYGVTVDVEVVKRNRTTEQNRYLWAIYKHIVEFYNDTGFVPDNLSVRYVNSDFLHEYFKARFDTKQTHNMSTAEFCAYTDKVQQLMIEQTRGEYTPIYPEQPFSIME